MTINRNTLLFFDSSCLIAAAGSPTGGSSFLLSLCARGFLRAALSQPVLLEVQKNIQSKLGDEAIKRFYYLLAIVPFSLASLPEKAEFEQLANKVNSKDVHVVAAALEVQAQYLLTLDKAFVLEVNKTGIGIQALLPGEFIKTILPTHVDHPPTLNTS
ncbi:MAG: PIN domain-containing protein [Anaerolineales bacterium]|jgi:predicted nucleic acid-binding protein